MILVALALLGAAVVVFVLVPVFEPASRIEQPMGEGQKRLRDLEEAKLRVYDAIKDLEFEKDAGKVSVEDYERARNDYLKQVAQLLARIDELAPQKEKPAKRKKAAKRSCTSCGGANPQDAKFCMSCGQALATLCSACGKTLPEEAKFCLFCGTKVAS